MLKKITPHMWVIGAVVLMAAAVAVLSYQVVAAGVVSVAGNTAAAENQPGWMFNRALTSATPFTFTTSAHSLGLGSLYVGPAANATDKFVAEFFPGKTTVANFVSFSYDYMIGQGGDLGDINQFNLSVLTNIDDSTNNYDCRFDYAARVGTQGTFSKQIVFTGAAPALVTKGSDRLTACPSTLEGMPAGSYIRVFALSMGDTGTDDTGLDAYFDNIEVALNGDATTYNFESGPQTSEDCSGKKWQQYKFRNQGQCYKYVEKGIDTR